jgi:predicted ester cyclase
VDVGATENAEVVRRLVDEAVNADRVDLLGEFVRPDVVVHPGTVGAAPATAGIEELATAFRRFHSVFPDLHVVFEDVVAEGDRVAARWTATGTHSAELAGLSATGRAVRWGGIDIYRLVDGKVAEWWRNDDFIWLLKQLGKLQVD